MLSVEPIKAYTDNYIWLVSTNEGSIVVDPGESKEILNLIDNNIVRHNLTLYREIDCWELFVDWTPNGYARGLYFRLNLKSDMLQDLKVEQKTGIYTTRPSF